MPARTTRSDRRSSARVGPPTFPEPVAQANALSPNTPIEDLGLALDKLRALAEVISLELDNGNAVLLADCMLDELRIAHELQQRAEVAEHLARAAGPPDD